MNEIAFEKIKLLKKQHGHGDATYGQWLTAISRNVNLDPTAVERVHENTRKSMLKLWMKNFGDNLPLIREGKTIRDLVPENPEKFPQGPAIVLGRGPSIFQHKHLEMLKENLADWQLRTGGMLIASDGILPDMLEREIVPDLVVTVDGSDAILRYYDHPLVRKNAHLLCAAIVTQTHPKVVKLLDELDIGVYWWIPMGDLPSGPESSTYQEICMTIGERNPQGAPSQEAGGNAGTAAWVMTWALLKRSPVALVGFDFGYPEGFDITQSYYYSTFIKYMDPDPVIAGLKAQTAFDEINHPVWHTKALIDPVFKGYREALYRMLERLPPWVKTYNATEGGTLWHDRLSCTRFQDFLSGAELEVKIQRP